MLELFDINQYDQYLYDYVIINAEGNGTGTELVNIADQIVELLTLGEPEVELVAI